MRTLRVLDLFSGIGGFALGFQRAGLKTVGFCEIEPFCRQILAKNFPGVLQHNDIRNLNGDCGGIDVVCGGFPCQDISTASARGIGIDGGRSSLWFEMLRVVRRTLPAWVVIENVPALRTRGSDRVLSGLEANGYSAWPCVVGAWACGRPHTRNRAWIVAHSERRRLQGRDEQFSEPQAVESAQVRCHRRGVDDREAWRSTPGLVRMAHGIPDQMDRIKALGNAVVPAIPELIGRWIMRQEGLCPVSQ